MSMMPNTGEKRAYRLRLYVAGDEPRSRAARTNLSRICREYLKDDCDIVVIDVLKDFAAALQDHIFVTPALLIDSPLPATIVGSLSDEAKVVTALGLRYGQ